MYQLIVDPVKTDAAVDNLTVGEDEMDVSMEELRVEDEEDDNRNNLNQVEATGIISQNTEKLIEIEQNELDDNQKAREQQLTTNLTNGINVEIETQEVPIESKTLNNLEAESTTISKKKNRLTIVDSESEDEGFKNSENMETTNVGNEINCGLHKPHLTSSDEAEKETFNNKNKTKVTKKFSALIDSDTNSDASADENDDYKETPESEFIEDLHHETSKNKRPKEMRASAKKALNEMQAIQSEQQRLHREAYISIPYHKPKKYTLQDFLKRRTIFKLQEQNEESTAKTPLKARSLKMTADELEVYAKLLEERAIEAQEFFKSDNEEDSTPTQNLETEDEVVLSHPESVEKNMLLAIDNDAAAVDEIDNSIEQNRKMTTTTDTDAQACTSTDKPLKPKVIITEVVELPRLDMSTINFTPPKPPAPKSKSEHLKQLLAENKVIESPSLRGDANMLIDLETGDVTTKKPTAVDNLLQRCLATNKARKSKGIETVNILSTENGKLEMSKVNIHVEHETDGANKTHKPGEAYFKLKENLKALITRKRLEEMKKKQEEENEHRKCLDEEEDYEYDKNKLTDNDDDDNDEDNDNEDESEIEIDEDAQLDDVIIDDEENEIDVNENIDSDEDKGHQHKNNKISDESDGDDDDNDDDNEDDNEENDLNANDNCESMTVEKPKSRILQIFQDASDEEEADSFSRPKLVDQFFQNEQTQNASQMENELMDLCSGRFEATQKPDTALISQIPITQKQTDCAETEELLGLCSGSFDGAELNTNDAKIIETNNISTQRSVRKIVSTDEEDEANDEDQKLPAKNKRNKKFTKKIKPNRAKLGFSDDEYEEDEDENKESKIKLYYNNCEKKKIEEEYDKVMPDTYIDYDSEENEIIVEMTKDECIKQANKFVENEAELSESDWGSADEDERNMNNYDIELGDEDEFDGDKLRHELGQIHARKMLDEDIKKVRKIQELFFEDEETDGVGRQRQFKWKNAENGFSLNDSNRLENDVDACGSGDEENEQMWRRIRYEREQLLQQQNIAAANTLKIRESNNIKNSPIGAGITIKKINIITGTKTSATTSANNSPFLILKNATKLQQQQSIRESFLNRDKDTLKKLAGLTKGNNGIAETIDPTGTVSMKAIKTSKNFVFATLTEEEHENKKRKADDLLNCNSEHGINYMKKPKMEPRQQKCLIDQLL